MNNKHNQEILDILKRFPLGFTVFDDIKISRLYDFSTNVFTLFGYFDFPYPIVITTDKYLSEIERIVVVNTYKKRYQAKNHWKFYRQ